MTWQECELKEKDVQFIVPEVTCADKQELWYHEPEPTKGSQMTNTFSCEINKSSHCSTQTRPDCKQITWNECREVPVSKCKKKKVHVPTQELLHRKKCLLPDDIALSAGNLIRDTNLVWDSATQSWTGHKSGTSNVYPLSNITKR